MKKLTIILALTLLVFSMSTTALAASVPTSSSCTDNASKSCTTISCNSSQCVSGSDVSALINQLNSNCSGTQTCSQSNCTTILSGCKSAQELLNSCGICLQGTSANGTCNQTCKNTCDTSCKTTCGTQCSVNCSEAGQPAAEATENDIPAAETATAAEAAQTTAKENAQNTVCTQANCAEPASQCDSATNSSCSTAAAKLVSANYSLKDLVQNLRSNCGIKANILSLIPCQTETSSSGQTQDPAQTPEASTSTGANTGSETSDNSGAASTTSSSDTGTSTANDNGGTSSSSDRIDNLSFEEQVVALVNQQRAANGLSPLTLSTELSNVARVKSQDMHDNQYFSHTSPTYGSPFDMLKTFGISYRAAGENIAMGYATPEAVMDAWMNSAGHRANILNSSYTQIGVGYVADGNYWTQEFIG